MLQTVRVLIRSKRRISLIAVAAFCIGLAVGTAKAQTENASAIPPLENVLYGAAYYHEYMPYDRLDKDVALMRQAGFSAVSVGGVHLEPGEARRP